MKRERAERSDESTELSDSEQPSPLKKTNKSSMIRSCGLSRVVHVAPTVEEEEEIDPEDVEFSADEFRAKVRFKKNHYLNDTTTVESCYLVKWINTNKNAKRDLKGSGLLVVHYGNCELQDMQGKIVGKLSFTREPAKMDLEIGAECDQKLLVKSKAQYLFPGNVVKIGTKAAQIKFKVDSEDYHSGSFFDRSVQETISTHKKKKALKKGTIIYALNSSRANGFVTPWKANATNRPRILTEPLHNPRAPGAVILYNPTKSDEIAVVVDPIVGKLLRPHQVEGVKFLYDCCMGIREYQGNGCILADDMGLGKTIQAITLVWTLINQGPKGVPAVKKAIIVAPSSLAGNWCQEFTKWLGDCVAPIKMADSNKKKRQKALNAFRYSRDIKTNILVTTYEQFLCNLEDILKIPDVDLCICDEGHRLKNASIKTSVALNRLETRKRVIMSGTPIQNNLEEFYAMVSFVNPGILNSLPAFKNTYIKPIEEMRDPESTTEEKKRGRARSVRLAQKTGQFILRRTRAVNQKYLPAKVDFLIICKLTPLQENIYRQICEGKNDNEVRTENSKGALPTITYLRKLCNHPSLIYSQFPKEFETEPNFDPNTLDPAISGKFLFLDNLLRWLRTKTTDKIVIVSNFVETLTVVEQLCQSRGYGYFSLSGSTKVEKRQDLVNLFNEPTTKEFIFLLSSKAGGCGLNLVGANHLVMFDPDWNPANDEQAMARVWRPGQQKRVYLYRTLSAGTIEEKIYQRQVAKLSLASNVMGNVDEIPDFSSNQLKALFVYKGDTRSETHDLLNCRCAPGYKKIPKYMRDQVKVDSLSTFTHCHQPENLDQFEMIQEAAESISFVFLKEDDPTKNLKEEDKDEDSETPVEEDIFGIGSDDSSYDHEYSSNSASNDE